jgi:RNA-directed DNA polymerase
VSDRPALEPYRGKTRRTVLQVLAKRFERFGLTLHPEKTRLVAFGHQALARATRMKTKTETFDFLGFTHKCARSRRGKFMVHVKTMKKRLRRSLQNVTVWCRAHRHDPVNKQQATLNAKLRSHYRYYGRPTNYRVSGSSNGASNVPGRSGSDEGRGEGT